MSIVRGGWEPCKALHYPSLDIEDVKHWFVQGAGGNRPLVARRKGNGAIELMTPHWSEHEFFAKGRALLAAPDAVRADVFLSLFLLYTDASEIIRCRPGTGDTLPGGCFEPTFERDGGKLFVKVIKEERPSAARGAVSIRKGMFVTPGKLWRYRYEFDAQTWDEKGGAGDGIP